MHGRELIYASLCDSLAERQRVQLDQRPYPRALVTDVSLEAFKINQILLDGLRDLLVPCEDRLAGFLMDGKWGSTSWSKACQTLIDNRSVLIYRSLMHVLREMLQQLQRKAKRVQEVHLVLQGVSRKRGRRSCANILSCCLHLDNAICGSLTLRGFRCSRRKRDAGRISCKVKHDQCQVKIAKVAVQTKGFESFSLDKTSLSIRFAVASRRLMTPWTPVA